MNTPTTFTDCPFCRANELLGGAVLAETSEAFLIRNKSDPENYLIIPDAHYESLYDLPDSWWASTKELLQAIPDLPADYNLSINIGSQAGQSVRHLHFWVIPRLAGTPASGQGLAKLIKRVNAD